MEPRINSRHKIYNHSSLHLLSSVRSIDKKGLWILEFGCQLGEELQGIRQIYLVYYETQSIAARISMIAQPLAIIVLTLIWANSLTNSTLRDFFPILAVISKSSFSRREQLSLSYGYSS